MTAREIAAELAHQPYSARSDNLLRQYAAARAKELEERVKVLSEALDKFMGLRRLDDSRSPLEVGEADEYCIPDAWFIDARAALNAAKE